jgi:hypothetical protein
MVGAQHMPLEEEERIGGGGAPPPTEYRAAPKSRRVEDDGARAARARTSPPLPATMVAPHCPSCSSCSPYSPARPNSYGGALVHPTARWRRPPGKKEVERQVAGMLQLKEKQKGIANAKRWHRTSGTN